MHTKKDKNLRNGGDRLDFEVGALLPPLELRGHALVAARVVRVLARELPRAQLEQRTRADTPVGAGGRQIEKGRDKKECSMSPVAN